MNLPFSPAEVRLVQARHEEYFDQFYSTPMVSRASGLLAGVCIWAMPVDPDQVISFVTQVVTGEMIQRGDPAYMYRQWWTRNKGASQWDTAMAIFNCVRHKIGNRKLVSVYVGESGYRGITTRRRALKIPNTPGNELVPSYSGGFNSNSDWED